MPRSVEPGTVYLVGAGPGDPELITVRGLALLRRADVVLYDRLAHPDLLAEAPVSAERIYVGKAAGRHACPQEAIHAILVAKARAGAVVVRLKGGDPFVFGRGGEEAVALAAAGVPFEVVPGVTSAVAVPAYAGIPVTHRGVAQAFTVVTGHPCDGGGDDAEADEPDWTALSQAGTLVVLMGLGRLPAIARRLVEAGRPPETPAAVVANGTTGAQQVVEGTLADIGARAAGLPSPATIVVGDVVRLRDQIGWFAPAEAAADGLTRPAFVPVHASAA